MLKYILVLSLIFACAFGGIFTPKRSPCAFHIYVDEYDDYFMLTSPTEGYIRMVNTSTDAVEIIRCDIKNDKGFCLYITHDPTKEKNCTEEWTDPSLGDWHSMNYYYRCADADFEYTTGPEPHDCPDPSQTGCHKYSNNKDFIIVDDEERLVYTVEGYVINWTTDAVDLSVFDVDYCNGTNVGAPETNVCPGKRKFSPTKPCAFHILAGEYDEYAMMNDSKNGYIRMVNNSNGAVEIVRCDIKNDKGLCLDVTRDPSQPSEKNCTVQWVDPSRSSWPEVGFGETHGLNTCGACWFSGSSTDFQFTKGPEPVECPAASKAKDCQRYINDNSFIIVDGEDRLVYTVQGWTIQWTNDVVDVSKFEVDYCDGNKTETPKDDVCPKKPASSSSSSKSPSPSPAPASSSKGPTPTPPKSASGSAVVISSIFLVLLSLFAALF